MQRILGVDPGSRCTGYGIIWVKGSQMGCITHGYIRTQTNETADRLHEIFSGLSNIIAEYQPHTSAIEKVFMHQNVQSALKLGQARGALMVALANAGLAVAEYSPREVKQATVGYGAASKGQIQHMVSSLLQLKEKPQADAADALAIAICHSSMQHFRDKLSKATVTAGEGA